MAQKPEKKSYVLAFHVAMARFISQRLAPAPAYGDGLFTAPVGDISAV
jgi:hypothetical protein